ncbi:MAG: molybdopterin converting factor subunit 1 [Vicinamibacteria bacterium]
MKVHLRLFAGVREIAGEDDIELDVDEGTTAGGLWERLLTDHPKLTAYTEIIQVAVNQDLVDRGVKLEPDDEVAFLPPVSGG